jgi:hypothetical protein
MKQNQPLDFRQSVIQQTVDRIFQGKSHLPPDIFAERAFGWSANQTYKFTCKNSRGNFPLPLTPIGGRKMVSAIDYLDFLSLTKLINCNAANTEVSIENSSKRGRGRPSNKEIAERAA